MSELCPGTPAGVCLRVAQTEGIKARDMQQSLRQKSSIFDTSLYTREAIRCGGEGPMSTRKGQAASVTLLRREQLRSASAPTKSIVDSPTSIRRKSRARLWSMESPENRPKGSLVVSFFSSRCDTVLFFLRIEKEKNGVAKFPQLFSCCCFLYAASSWDFFTAYTSWNLS